MAFSSWRVINIWHFTLNSNATIMVYFLNTILIPAVVQNIYTLWSIALYLL